MITSFLVSNNSLKTALQEELRCICFKFNAHFKPFCYSKVIYVSFPQVPSDILPMKDLLVKADGQGCALMQVGVSRVVRKDIQ